MSRGKSITPRQSTAIIASLVIGAGILTLPRDVAAAAGTDAPAATLMGGILATLLLLFFTKLAQRFSQYSLMEYSSQVLGPLPGKILSLIFVIYWLLIIAGVVRTFGEMVITAVLINTPLEVTIGIMLLLGGQLAAQKVKVVARIHELFLPLTVIPLVAIVIVTIPEINTLHLQPLFANGFGPIGEGILATTFAFLGVEAVLILFPYYTEPDQAVKYHLYGIAIPLLLYSFLVTVTVGTFGSEGLQHLQWPTLEQVRLAYVPGIFERLEAAFIGIWVLVVFTSVGGLLQLVSLGTTHLLGIEGRNRLWHYFLLVPLFFLARYPQNIIQLGFYLELVARFGLAVVLAIPILIYLVALVRGKQGGVKQNG